MKMHSLNAGNPLAIFSLITTLGFFSINNYANAAIIVDFDHLAEDGTSLITASSPYSEDGFTVTTSNGDPLGLWQNQGDGFIDSPAAFTSGGVTVEITQNDLSNEMILDSIDFAPVLSNLSPSNYTLLVSGEDEFGNPLSQLCNVISGQQTTCDFNNFVADRISFTEGSIIASVVTFDNVTYSPVPPVQNPVPEPAIIILFASGLGFIRYHRRKQMV